MKKPLLFFAAVVSVALTGCTSEEILQQEKPQTTEALTDAIVFGGTAPAMTRANYYGSDAATRPSSTHALRKVPPASMT